MTVRELAQAEAERKNRFPATREKQVVAIEQLFIETMSKYYAVVPDRRSETSGGQSQLTNAPNPS